ncbi:MAG: indole-3-glycerol-phosphate synthase [Deltaproteobacteria bacterium]|jgi:indole-3-glycerol phosphate synthase|nr:indole-3-glycerol-phosphate synthase [Deltaproteobacteria bacterium]
MLERFRKAKAAEIAALEKLTAQGNMPHAYAGPRPSLRTALTAGTQGAVMAEYKRASPSQGDLNLALTPEEAAAAYARNGAAAISVLTEEHYFKGHPDYLGRMAAPGLPLLRKDFILHPLQAEQTAATPAAALLLIARLLDDQALRAVARRSLDMGLEIVAEIFDAGDLARMRRLMGNHSLIQVNNRDLERLEVDPNRSAALIRSKKPGECWICASGITGPEQLARMFSLGFDAALIGSALMRSKDPGQALSALLKRKNHADAV